ncbi:MAG: beta-N-acetylhexosaminidase [Parachlamydiales bacterium]|nr:beta-N-acetylhexosaminidase [Parachlamydiales bacterium]
MKTSKKQSLHDKMINMMRKKFFFFLLFFYFSSIQGYEISHMTLEEKVGQLFMVYFDGDYANETAQNLLKEAKVGGIILYNQTNKLENPRQIQALCRGLQQSALSYIGIPLFIAIDQEGGLIARLKTGFTDFPSNAALGRTKQPQLALKAAQYIGEELLDVGINWNLAPVVDIDNNPQNPVIGIRSFGDNPKLVTQFGRKSMEGYQNAGVIPCLKHFPGHGDVTVDSHEELPVVSKSLSQLWDCELYPYRSLAKKAPAIMTAHILFPQIDPQNCASLSSIFLKELLREKLSFRGVLITDSLTMLGALNAHNNSYSLEQVVFKAIAAGNDMVLIGQRNSRDTINEKAHIEEIVRIVHHVVHAVRTGKIQEDRIDESVRRILLLKNSLREDPSSISYSRLSPNLQSKEHQDLSREIAYRSVQVRKWDLTQDLSIGHIAIVAPNILEKTIYSTDLMQLGTSATLHLFEGLSPSDREIQKIEAMAENCDYILFCSYNAWKFSKQSELCNRIAKKKPLIYVATRDPRDLAISHHSVIDIATYSPSVSSLQVVSDWLQKNTNPLRISKEQMREIGHKIWHNECNNREDQLTFWNEKEPFPSIGIGHFIWPPKDYNGIFSTGRFHYVLEFLQQHKVSLPSWLSNTQFSPWATREEFYKEFRSEKMEELRSFLVKTIPYQALYMVQRLNRSFFDIVLNVPFEKRENIIHQFFRVANTQNGPYILVDYCNFKGTGTDPKERYCNQGWGLLQVLESMAYRQNPDFLPEKQFAETAKYLLQQRIKNSPNPEEQQKWLPGWCDRLKTYDSN